MGVILALAVALAGTAAERFREANDLARSGDHPKAIELYREITASGAESASLYWNWSQAARARGAGGEALWALLRARELDPGDRAVSREVERLREALNLDPAEIAPEPLTTLARFARRFRLDLAAVTFLALSLLGRVARSRAAAVVVGIALAVGLLLAGSAVLGSLARPTGVVIRRGVALVDAASPTAEATGTLREGEVIPILEASGDYVRIEDSSGARGWALREEVRRLDAAPGR